MQSAGKSLPSSLIKRKKTNYILLDEQIPTFGQPGSTKTIDELTTALREQDETINRLKSRLSDRERELQAAVGNIKELQESKAKFLDIILNDAGNQGITDDAVTTQFRFIRQEIQAIAKRTTIARHKSSFPSNLSRQLEQDMSDFYGTLLQNNFSANDYQSRIRAKMFDLLWEDCLGLNCFGLRGYKRDGQYPEDLLYWVEKIMRDAGGKISLPNNQLATQC